MTTSVDDVLDRFEKQTTDGNARVRAAVALRAAEQAVTAALACPDTEEARVLIGRARRLVDEAHMAAHPSAAMWRWAQQLALAQHAAAVFGDVGAQSIAPPPEPRWSGLAPGQARLGKFGR